MFLRALATDAPVPGEVAQFMARVCLPEAWALGAVLWLLGTGVAYLWHWRWCVLARSMSCP